MAKDLNMSLLLDFYSQALTDKQRDVMYLYYNEDLSLAEIADGCGITRQGVRDSIKRGEATMLSLEQQLGFSKWYNRIKDTAEQIRAGLEALNAANEIGNTAMVKKKSADIEKLLDSLT